MSLPKQLLEAKICNKDTCEIKKKLDKYEDPEDLTLFHMWLDEKAKDKIKQLQEENKNLKQINEEHRKLNGELREENEKSKNGVSLEKASDKTMILTQKFVIEQLKTRINKAIEYIKNDMPYLEEPDDDYENNHKMVEYDNSILLNILQGSDE